MLLLLRLKAPTFGAKRFDGNPAVRTANRCTKRDKKDVFELVSFLPFNAWIYNG